MCYDKVMPEIIIFVLGLAVGSFLNVLIDRLPKDKSIIKGRSYCDHCKKPLRWYDLIPLLSFLILKGKCRNCHFSISFYYPMVELVTGVVFVLTFDHLRGGSLDIVALAYYLFILSSLIVIFFTDLKYGIIPDKIVYPAILTVSIYTIFNFQFSIFNYFLSALGAFLFFLILYLVTKGRGMGFGDVKLVFILGLFLGFPKAVVAFYIAFLTGAIFGCILIVWGKKKFFGGTIPFGPYLVLGTFISLFWGEAIMYKVFRFLL